MKELLRYMAEHLVDNAEAIEVTEASGVEETILKLRVAPEDMGKVIGKNGRIAREMRTILRAAGQRDNARFSMEIVE